MTRVMPAPSGRGSAIPNPKFAPVVRLQHDYLATRVSHMTTRWHAFLAPEPKRPGQMNGSWWGRRELRPSRAKALIEHYARRMTIEQRLAEIIRAFCADALSSAVNLNVDLDVMLAVLAQALLAGLRARLPSYAHATPDTIQRRFLETPGQIIATDNTITVRLERRAYSPVLRQADLPAQTRVPCWGDRILRFEFS